MFNDREKKQLGIYLHIPFCVRKCRYCDFLSFPAEVSAREEYVRMLLQETGSFWQRHPQLSKEDYTVPSIFIGGGTPSILETEQIVRILESVRESFPVEGGAEVTVECNPGTGPDFLILRRAGVNRISFGVQSAQDEQLELLGRIHTWEDVRSSMEEAAAAGFSNISADLIFSIPGQSCASWQDTLEKTAALPVTHISAYSLIIEEGTDFYRCYHEDDMRRSRGERPAFLPDEETERQMFHHTEQVLGERGYSRYEISNYAMPGYESIHNTGYWLRREYAGLGLGASSQIEDRRFKNTSDFRKYLSGDLSPREELLLSDQDARSEAMFLGLRMTRGVDTDAFLRRYHISVEDAWPGTVEGLIRKGLLVSEHGHIRLTPRGTDLGNYVFASFL